MESTNETVQVILALGANVIHTHFRPQGVCGNTLISIVEERGCLFDVSFYQEKDTNLSLNL